MNRKEQLEQLRNAMGMTAEMSLIFYRAALGAGASMEEAMKLVQAYIAAVLFGQNKKAPEGEGGSRVKAVLMSVKPEWWEKILSGEKTMEIRKSAPQSKDGRAFRWPLTILVYVSGTGAVQGKFTCWGWVKTNLLEMLVERSRVPLEDLRAYAKSGSLYGWVIQFPEKFNTPSPLAEFGLNHPPMSWRYVEIPDAAAEV